MVLVTQPPVGSLKMFGGQGKKNKITKQLFDLDMQKKKQILKKHVKIDEFVFPYVSIIGY